MQTKKNIHLHMKKEKPTETEKQERMDGEDLLRGFKGCGTEGVLLMHEYGSQLRCQDDHNTARYRKTILGFPHE